MGAWGKVLGGMAGFAMGGPFGAVVGAALGHAADERGLPNISMGGGLTPARLLAVLGGREQVFAFSVVVLSAKLARVDGPVVRAEIDAFKRQFRIPPDGVRDIGRLFDQARDSREAFEPYARQLGDSFSDNRGLLEDVLASLFAIARADRPLTNGELDMLARIHVGFGLDQPAWERARGGVARATVTEDDPYAVLGIERAATAEILRARWKQLMREHHPDSLASRGVPPEFVQRASDKVARINAAWDRIKRERGL